VVDSCEYGNKPPSSIKCGECSLFPSWAKDLSAPLYVYCIQNIQVVYNIINTKLKFAYLKDFIILGLGVHSAAHQDVNSNIRHTTRDI